MYFGHCTHAISLVFKSIRQTFHCVLHIRAAQIFRGLMLQTPNLRLAQILKVYQVPGASGDV